MVMCSLHNNENIRAHLPFSFNWLIDAKFDITTESLHFKALKDSVHVAMVKCYVFLYQKCVSQSNDSLRQQIRWEETFARVEHFVSGP